MTNYNYNLIYSVGESLKYTNPIIFFVYVSKGDSLHAATANVRNEFEELLHNYTDGDFNGLSICQTASLHFNDQALEFSSARRFPAVVQLEGTFKYSFLEDLMQEVSSNLGIASSRIMPFEEAPRDLQLLVTSYADEPIDITKQEITVRRLGAGSALEIY